MSVDYSILSEYRKPLLGVATWGVLLCHLWLVIEQLLADSFIDSVNYYHLLSNIFLFIPRIAGIEAFLLLSGMGLYHSYYENSELLLFFKKRIKRVLFPFIVISFGYYLSLFFIYEKYSIGRFFLDLSSLSFWIYGNNGMWYISISLILYLLFPMFYWFIFHRNSNRIFRMLFLCILFSLLNVFVAENYPSYYQEICIGLSKIPAFLLGIFLGMLSKEGRMIKLKELLMFCVLFVVLFFCRNNLFFSSFFTLSLRILGIVFVLLFLSLKKTFVDHLKSFFSYWGTYSLEVYILNIITLNITRELGYSWFNCWFLVLIPLVFSPFLKKKIERVEDKFEFLR